MKNKENLARNATMPVSLREVSRPKCEVTIPSPISIVSSLPFQSQSHINQKRKSWYISNQQLPCQLPPINRSVAAGLHDID
jgi:hypothetical protein